MQIISLNSLLRDYESKYRRNSKYLKRYPDELERVNTTVKFVFDLSSKDTIICLQECSALLLNQIKIKFSNEYCLFSQKVDDNPEDNLITLIPKSFGSFYKVTPKSKLDGIVNGLLIISNGECVVVNCHLIPQKHCKKDVNVLECINNEFSCNIPTIVTGDFNAVYEKVSKVFNQKFNVPFFCNTYRRTQLDYILISKNSNCDFYKKTVVHNDFSDHNLIKLEVCKYT